MVAKANSISLFDGVTASVTAPLDRNQVAQLALNALESTMVEMSDNTLNVETTVGGATTTVSGGQIDYVARADGNAGVRAAINSSKETVTNTVSGVTGLTLELGEFLYQGDLKKIGSYDAYGRPSDTWSWKNIEIGTYAHGADFSYTAAASGDTDVDKVKNMSLQNFYIGAWDSDSDGNADSYTQLTVNGLGVYLAGGGTVNVPAGVNPLNAESTVLTFSNAGLVKTTDPIPAAMLANFVKNGALVEIYLDGSRANVISEIAVTQTQIMQVNRVGAKDVTLKTVESQGIAGTGGAEPVAAVKSNDDAFEILKDLEADDFVVVTPLTENQGNTYTVDEVYVPETVEGILTKVDLNKAGTATGVSLDGEPFSMSRNWTADGGRGTVSASSVTTKQSSRAYFDAYDYVIYMEDVVSRDDFIIFDEWISSLVGGTIHYIAKGWNLSGDELELDMGTQAEVRNGIDHGYVYAYKLSENNNNADYWWDFDETTAKVFTYGTTAASAVGGSSNWQAVSAQTIQIKGRYLASNVKTVFLTFDSGTGVQTVDTVTVKSGAQKLSDDIVYQVVLNGKNEIKGIVVRDDRDVEVSQNILYVEKATGSTKDSSGKTVSIVTAWIGEEKVEGIILNKQVPNDSFWTYRVNSDDVYEVNGYQNNTQKSTSVLAGIQFNTSEVKSEAYLPYDKIIDAPEAIVSNLDFTHVAKVVDLRAGGTLSSIKDMVDAGFASYTVSLIYNDTQDGQSQGRVTYMYITGASTSPAVATVVRLTIDTGLPIEISTSLAGPWGKSVVINNKTGVAYIRATAGTKITSFSGQGLTAKGFDSPEDDEGDGIWTLKVTQPLVVNLMARAGTATPSGEIKIGSTTQNGRITGYTLKNVGWSATSELPYYTLEVFGNLTTDGAKDDEDFADSLLNAIRELDEVTNVWIDKDTKIHVQVGNYDYEFDDVDDMLDVNAPDSVVEGAGDGDLADMMPSTGMDDVTTEQGGEGEADTGTVTPEVDGALDVGKNPSAGATDSGLQDKLNDQGMTEGAGRTTIIHVTLDYNKIVAAVKTKVKAEAKAAYLEYLETETEEEFNETDFNREFERWFATLTLLGISHNESLLLIEAEHKDKANGGDIGINVLGTITEVLAQKTDDWNVLYAENADEAPYMEFFAVEEVPTQWEPYWEYTLMEEAGITPDYILRVNVSGVTFAPNNSPADN